MWGKRGSGEGSTLYAWLSSIALLPWLPGVPPQTSPPPVSSLTSPGSVFHSLQQPSPWDYSTVPKFKLPAAVPPRGPSSLSRVCMAVARTVWFSFYLSCHGSAVTCSAFLLWLRQLPQCGDRTPASVPPPTKGRSSPTNTPSSFILVPLSYRVFCGSIFSFPLTRYSCPLSAGICMHLCLKVHSWCIHGERCTPDPPTPPPSCSLPE